MKDRCPESSFLRRAFLSHYKFVYDGISDTREGPVANIIETGIENDVVWGGLFEISPNDRDRLDDYEGYPEIYDIKEVKVKDDGKKSYDAFVYFRIGEVPGTPHENYRKIVVEGAKDCDLPEEYIENNLG
jgi:gamma-glutamylcyclotransferase (GGCT)/AIG2-like uncharacterized protein YtfP